MDDPSSNNPYAAWGTAGRDGNTSDPALRAAAISGNPYAQVQLGIAYIVAGDRELARDWYERAAAGGLAQGAFKVAEWHMGAGGCQADCDPASARPWFIKAAKGGEQAARYWLATMLEEGRGGPVDILQAMAWYQIALQDGHVHAGIRLALLYARELDIYLDPLVVYQTYFGDAACGESGAMGVLASAFRDGDLVQRDPVTAYKWQSLAVLGRWPDDGMLDELTAELGEHGVKRAQREIVAWKKEHPDALEALIRSGIT